MRTNMFGEVYLQVEDDVFTYVDENIEDPDSLSYAMITLDEDEDSWYAEVFDQDGEVAFYVEGYSDRDDLEEQLLRVVEKVEK